MRGRVQKALALERSPLGQRECVYWDTRHGLEDAPRAQGAVDFWLEHEGGRVLVRTDRMQVEARAERRAAVLGQVDHDIHEVAERQRAVKDALRAGTGDVRALHREKTRLARLATLLCAVRADARGRVHVGGSLAAQKAWIAANAAEVAAGPGEKTLRLTVEQWEVVLAPGDEIEIEGELSTEPAPAGLGRGGGYREQASVDVLRAPRGGSLVVRGVGASSVGQTVKPAPAPRARVRMARSRSQARPWSTERVLVAAVSAVVGALMLLAWLSAR